MTKWTNFPRFFGLKRHATMDYHSLTKDMREEDDGAARPDHDVPDLEGLVAERDRVRAEVERLRREKREAEIELAILKGALDLVGKERGADPDNPANREKDDPPSRPSVPDMASPRGVCSPGSAWRAARTIIS